MMTGAPSEAHEEHHPEEAPLKYTGRHWMYKLLRHVLIGIIGQFTKCELEHLGHWTLNSQPQ